MPPSEPGRILLIKPSAIGDVVHSLPILTLLRKRFPQSHIAWLVSPACAGLLEGHPDLSEVILFDRKRFGKAWRNPLTALDLLQFHRSLRRRQFDMVIDLQGLFRSGWLAWTTRAPVRMGFANAREGAPLFYTSRVDVGSPEQHAIRRYLKLARSLGCDTAAPLEFRFPITPAHRAIAASLLNSNHPYAVLLPGTNWPTKRWRIEAFADLIEPLHERFGLQSIVAGGPDVKPLAAKLPKAQDLTGKTSLLELAALLENASLVIANDSGPMHIAAALGRPLVTIFGPTNPIRTGPYGRPETVVRHPIECSPCYQRSCWHHSCMKNLDVETVLAAAARQLGTARALQVLQA